MRLKVKAPPVSASVWPPTGRAVALDFAQETFGNSCATCNLLESEIQSTSLLSKRCSDQLRGNYRILALRIGVALRGAARLVRAIEPHRLAVLSLLLRELFSLS